MADDKDNDPKPKLSDDTKLKVSKNVTVVVKLNGTNYSIWARLVKIQIGSRRVLRHINGNSPPPEPGADGYTEWEETDLIAFSWILDNIETDIVIDFAHHQTTEALWKSLAVTFESTFDLFLLFDLEEKAENVKQGEQSLETYWRHLHGTWIDVDRCQEQPVTCCDKGIGQFWKYVETQRLFKFLTGLNPRHDQMKREILKDKPWPSAEVAYGWIKRETARLRIMPATTIEPTVATNDTSSSGGIGLGFAARNQQRSGQQPPHRIRTPTAPNLSRPHLSSQRKRSYFATKNIKLSQHIIIITEIKEILSKSHRGYKLFNQSEKENIVYTENIVRSKQWKSSKSSITCMETHYTSYPSF